jgi:hypothetical protein
MKKARAALGAIVGLTLTATGAFAASGAGGTMTTDAGAPTDSHGDAVSTVAQDHAAVGGPNNNHGGVVSTVAMGTHGAPDTTTSDTTTPDTNDPAGAQGAHGAAVTAVAQNHTAVGGTNNNHGGAVSLAARGTHGPTAVHGQSAGHSQASVHKPAH